MHAAIKTKAPVVSTTEEQRSPEVDEALRNLSATVEEGCRELTEKSHEVLRLANNLSLANTAPIPIVIIAVPIPVDSEESGDGHK